MHLLAAYVLYHVISVVVAALPALYGVMDRQMWKDPTVQNEFDSWAKRLDEWGVEMTGDRLEDFAWRLAGGWKNARAVLMTPFDDYQRCVGAQQSWSMFVAPHRHPSRLCIDRRAADGAWIPLYVARSREHRWPRVQFDHIRFRSAIFRYAWPQYRRSYEDLVQWIAGEVGTDFPETEQVRVRFFRFTTLSAEQIRRGEKENGAYVYERIISLDRRP